MSSRRPGRPNLGVRTTPLSWQVVPASAIRALNGSDQKKADRVMAAVMEMKKFDVAKLEAAIRG